MLSKNEIYQLHTQTYVVRESKIAKIPVLIKSFTLGDELGFVATFDTFNNETEITVRNTVARETLKRCLVSFNGVPVTAEMISSFTDIKAKMILEEFSKLTADIEEYLGGYETQPLTTEEVEEFILTDTIVRNNKFDFEEDIPAFEISYRILNIQEHLEVGDELKKLIEDKKVISKLHAETLKEWLYASKMVDRILGIPIREYKDGREALKDIGVEVLKFVLTRADALEKMMKDLLKSPEKLSEELKNS